MNKMKKLYELPKNQNVKLYFDDIVVTFGHIDGFYSYCWLGEDKSKIIHVKATTTFKKYKDGYKYVESRENMNKKMRKIRELLGEDYHICETLDIEKGNSWVLYSTCNNNSISYFSKYNKPIMTSEKNTLDELYAFAKRHHKLNDYLVSFVLSIYAWFVFILSILNNFLFCNMWVNGFVIGGCVGTLLYSIVIYIIESHNFKVKKLKYIEMLESWGKDDE